MSYENLPPQDDNNPYARSRYEPWQQTTLPQGNDPYGTYDEARLSQLGLWSMILGIIGLCTPLLGVVPLIMGIVGVVRINAARGALHGKGLAITGIVLGGCGLLLSCCTGAVYFAGWGMIGGPNTLAAQLVDEQNLTDIAFALELYHLDYDEDPAHVGELVSDGYLFDNSTFQMLPTIMEPMPVYLGPNDERVYRFGDYVFAYAGQRDDRGNLPSDAVLAYSAQIDPNQQGRYVLLGSGQIVFDTEADFRDRIDRENQRRAAQGNNDQIDVDALD